MKRYLIWLRTEYKRAAAMLPSVFIRAVVAAIAVGMIVFCVVKMFPDRNQDPLVRIGYSAPDDQMTRLAVSYVENMESVRGWCTFTPMDRETGLRALKQGDIAALLVLPEHVIDDILTGENRPGKLYLSSKYAFMGQLFKELAIAGVGMLQTAQAEIYATHKLVTDLSQDSSQLEIMYQEIDDLNLQIVMNREQYFHTRTLTLTENMSIAVYYGGAVLGAFLMLLGVMWGRYWKRNLCEIRTCSLRLGISLWKQVVGRTGITCLMLAVCFLPIILIGSLPVIEHAVSFNISLAAIILLILSFISMAVWMQLISLLGENEQIITWILTLTAIVSAYFSGYVLPTALLPDVVKRIALFLPSTYYKQAFSSLFSGTVEQIGSAVPILVIWIVLPAVIYVLISGKHTLAVRIKDGDIHVGQIKNRSINAGESTILILAKRLMYRKSFLVCLLLTVVLSGLAVKLEKRSETTVYAGLYTEDKELENLLLSRNGLVKFIAYDREEEMIRNVRNGYLECGYVLQEGLQNKILDGNGNWSITVYEKPDSTLTRMINEVLFERVFYNITSNWYAGYIANNSIFETAKSEIGESRLRERAAQVLSEELAAGSTFTIAVNDLNQEDTLQQEEDHGVTYPVGLIMICNLLFSGFLGLKQNMTDRRVGRFPKRSESYMSTITIMLPIGIAGLVDLGLILFII